MKLIIGNLKMNLQNEDVNKYVNYFKDKQYKNVYFAPTSIYFSKFVDNGLTCVSQDVSPFDNGAYTGDVSALQVKSMGVNYSLVGHSERRKYYNDSLLVNDKIKKLLSNEIVPILCIGETLEERHNGKTFDILEKEIKEAFKDIDNTLLKKIIVAYEPVWAIGTGEIPTMNEIKEVSAFIKKYIQDYYGFSVKVLYGGSVNNSCIEELETIDNIDGYLVGGCSLKCEEFVKLVNSIK